MHLQKWHRGRHRCPQGQDFPPGLGWRWNPAEKSQAWHPDSNPALKSLISSVGKGVEFWQQQQITSLLSQSNKWESAPPGICGGGRIGNYSLQIFQQGIHGETIPGLGEWTKSSFEQRQSSFPKVRGLQGHPWQNSLVLKELKHSCFPSAPWDAPQARKNTQRIRTQ